MIWYDMIWYDKYDTIWYDMLWYDMICDMIWYDMIWYFLICYDIIWYDLIWFDMIGYDMIWYDMIWYDMIWYDMIWYDMIWYALGWLRELSDECLERSIQRLKHRGIPRCVLWDCSQIWHWTDLWYSWQPCLRSSICLRRDRSRPARPRQGCPWPLSVPRFVVRSRTLMGPRHGYVSHLHHSPDLCNPLGWHAPPDCSHLRFRQASASLGQIWHLIFLPG